MKFTPVLSMLAVCAVSSLSLVSCGKKENVQAKNGLSDSTLNQIKALGFTTTDAREVEGGVVVEGDILLTQEMLSSAPADAKLLRVGQDEQYRTTNLVTRLPRTLTVKMVGSFPTAYYTAIDEAIRRYNAEGLQLRFTRITSGTADLPITSEYLGSGVLGQSGGFPSGGNPAPGFKLSPSVINSSNTGYLATIMAHEMGHCIGFRHTDYFNRQYSCGGSYANEGASSVGAILIPGTPSGADPNSWMLACVGTGVSRPFNTNDRTALNYLY